MYNFKFYGFVDRSGYFPNGTTDIDNNNFIYTTFASGKKFRITVNRHACQELKKEEPMIKGHLKNFRNNVLDCTRDKLSTFARNVSRRAQVQRSSQLYGGRGVGAGEVIVTGVHRR